MRVQLPTGSGSSSAAMCAGKNGFTASSPELLSPAGPAVAAATPLANGSDSAAAAGGGACRTGPPAVAALPCRGDETFEVTVQVRLRSSVTEPANVLGHDTCSMCVSCPQGGRAVQGRFRYMLLSCNATCATSP
jgi:hypothetical protein